MTKTANRISPLREMAKMDEKQLAHIMGVVPETVKRWEAGATSIPDDKKLRLAALFEVSVDFLMGWPTYGNGPQS